MENQLLVEKNWQNFTFPVVLTFSEVLQCIEHWGSLWLDSDRMVFPPWFQPLFNHGIGWCLTCRNINDGGNMGYHILVLAPHINGGLPTGVQWDEMGRGWQSVEAHHRNILVTQTRCVYTNGHDRKGLKEGPTNQWCICIQDCKAAHNRFPTHAYRSNLAAQVCHVIVESLLCNFTFGCLGRRLSRRCVICKDGQWWPVLCSFLVVYNFACVCSAGYAFTIPAYHSQSLTTLPRAQAARHLNPTKWVNLFQTHFSTIFEATKNRLNPWKGW